MRAVAAEAGVAAGTIFTHFPDKGALLLAALLEDLAAIDQRILERLLANESLSYLGLIGSRGKIGRFRKRLAAKGIVCVMCVARCPERAVRAGPSGAVSIEAAACTGCGACIPACPVDALASVERVENPS